MSKEYKIISFRDNTHLLDKLDDNINKSDFIREALKLRLTLGKEVFEEELRKVQELIEFYQDRVNRGDEQLKTLDSYRRILKKILKEDEKELNRLKIEANKIHYIIEQEKEITETDELNNIRKNTFNTMIKSIISQKMNPSLETINLDFIFPKTEYATKDEFEYEILKYVKNNVQKGEVISKKIITEADIKYIKKRIKEIIHENKHNNQRNNRW